MTNNPFTRDSVALNNPRSAIFCPGKGLTPSDMLEFQNTGILPKNGVFQRTWALGMKEIKPNCVQCCRKNRGLCCPVTRELKCDHTNTSCVTTSAKSDPCCGNKLISFPDFHKNKTNCSRPVKTLGCIQKRSCPNTSYCQNIKPLLVNPSNLL